MIQRREEGVREKERVRQRVRDREQDRDSETHTQELRRGREVAKWVA